MLITKLSQRMASSAHFMDAS